MFSLWKNRRKSWNVGRRGERWMAPCVWFISTNLGHFWVFWLFSGSQAQVINLQEKHQNEQLHFKLGAQVVTVGITQRSVWLKHNFGPLAAPVVTVMSTDLGDYSCSLSSLESIHHIDWFGPKPPLLKFALALFLCSSQNHQQFAGGFMCSNRTTRLRQFSLNGFL